MPIQFVSANDRGNLPYQYTEESFRQYEPLILQVLSNYPQATQSKVFTLSPETVVKRFRDAIRSFQIYNWASTIDRELVDQLFGAKSGQRGEFIVTHANGEVYIGPKTKERPQVKAVSLTLDGTLDGTDEELVNAIAVLKSRDLLPDPLEFSNLTDEHQELFISYGFIVDQQGNLFTVI